MAGFEGVCTEDQRLGGHGKWRVKWAMIVMKKRKTPWLSNFELENRGIRFEMQLVA